MNGNKNAGKTKSVCDSALKGTTETTKKVHPAPSGPSPNPPTSTTIDLPAQTRTGR